MRFIKASERLPEVNKHVVLKQGNQFYGVYYSEKHKMIYSLLTHHYWPTTDLETMEDLAWLDESTPASAVEEAKALYPYPDESEYDEYAYEHLKERQESRRQAHITCAGMYTGEIDKLKAENSKMRKTLEGVRKLANKLLFGQPTPPEAAETISDIEVIATEALKTT